jgi:hypothetical protein
MRNHINWTAIARLAPGATRESAGTELSGIGASIRAADPASDYMYGVVVSWRSRLAGDGHYWQRAICNSDRADTIIQVCDRPAPEKHGTRIHTNCETRLYVG